MNIQGKILHREAGIANWDIFEVEWVFARARIREILSAKLYQNLARSLSPNEYLFKWNGKLFKHNDHQYNRQIYNLLIWYIPYDTARLPENFVKLFDIDTQSPTIQSELDEIFQRARLLKKDSSRIIFIDDKIIIFKNEEKLVHKGWRLTKWEKRRSRIQTIFNTFSNIYDAVRSQYYTIQSSQEKQDDYKLSQQRIIELAQEIRTLGFDVKDWAFRRKLNYIISEIEWATNFRILWANLHNLQNLTFGNKITASKSLEWAKNKLLNRFKDLQKIIWIVANQLNDLENILTEHQRLLELLLPENPHIDPPISRNKYNESYLELAGKYWKISPFDTFHQWTQKHRDNKYSYPKILHRIETLFKTYKDEHQKKLSWIDFDPDIFKEFGKIKDNLKYIEDTIIK